MNFKTHSLMYLCRTGQSDQPGRKKPVRLKDTYSLSAGAKSFSGSDQRRCSYNSCSSTLFLTSSGVRESGNKQKNSYEGLTEIHMWESSSVCWDKNIAIYRLDAMLGEHQALHVSRDTVVAASFSREASQQRKTKAKCSCQILEDDK